MPEKELTAVILAGGEGRRMGGVDKGLVPLAGKPMIDHVIARLQPQVHHLLINANRSHEQYRGLGWPVVADQAGGHAGPLMGMLTAMRHVQASRVLIAPCDTPLLPHDLVCRMWEAATSDVDIVQARDRERVHPVVALLRTALADDLSAALAAGERRIDRWYARHRLTSVCFESHLAFTNVNHESDAQALLPLLDNSRGDYPGA
ncbi:molybdenum cofactor guanylyltransferase [Kushneria sinocarnis]|uniref:Molybdenum cofactor guanylyltransferase n=1 Tax=Kushneria sinocarnis TaxID=595502 RepID=A0A420WXU7_9GAMM|nr:molybdenum cofactor guanylyltransferase MobA [Kushneria sinocarnis]RKR06032.1 molybdenum cofactor guanylyltransferase [Kushneria sinocarnis]